MRIDEKHSVPRDIDPIRIYDYCLGLFQQLPSRKSVKKALDRGHILLNGSTVKTGFWLKGGECLELIDPETTPPKTYSLDLEVVFEDDDLAVVFKPSGLLTSGNAFKTVVNALSHNLKPSLKKDAMNWPKPVHRLDRPTSGLLLIAKTKTARMRLGQQFEQHEIQKTYQAVVMGKLEGKGKIDLKIEQKEALTHYESLIVSPCLHAEYLSLVKLYPKTGRTHQLRIHLSSIGHAILGDQLYSPDELKLKHKGLFLCATGLKFEHPIKKEVIEIQHDLPEKFIKRLKSGKKRWQRQKIS